MANALEPRKVAPGAFRRWGVQSLELLRRGTACWALSAAFFVGLGFLSHRWWYLLGLVGLWGHVHFQLMANRADRDALRIFELPEYVLGSLVQSAIHLHRTPISTLINIGLCILLPHLFGEPAAAYYASMYADLKLSAIGTGLLLGAYLLSLGPGFITHGFLLAQLAGGSGATNFTAAIQLGLKQRQKNGVLGFLFDIAVLLLILVSMISVPVLAVVCAFCGAFSYVSFRDIYLHQDGNAKSRSSQTVTSLVPAKLPSRG